MSHVDQYRGSATWKPGEFFRRIDLSDKPRFSGVYDHTHDNGYTITSVPHGDDVDCQWALDTCAGKCEAPAQT